MKGSKYLASLKSFHKNEIFVLKGFDDAILGFDVISDRLIYSTKKCIKILSKNKKIESPEEHFYNKVYNSKKSVQHKVIFCEDYLIQKEIKNERFR
jgi:hypothetical protein